MTEKPKDNKPKKSKQSAKNQEENAQEKSGQKSDGYAYHLVFRTVDGQMKKISAETREELFLNVKQAVFEMNSEQVFVFYGKALRVGPCSNVFVLETEEGDAVSLMDETGTKLREDGYVK